MWIYDDIHFIIIAYSLSYISEILASPKISLMEPSIALVVWLLYPKECDVFVKTSVELTAW